SLFSLLFRGLDGSVDFTGGTIVEAPNHSGADVAGVRSALTSIGQEGARVQIRIDPLTDEESIIVQTPALNANQQDELNATVADVAGVSHDETNVEAVGPSFGAEITRRMVRALIIFLLVVAAFITWRFEWKMAAAALVALFHDLIVTAGVYSLVGFEVTPATVIAVLTILGYSLYDTVVVFDKITENVRDLGNRHTFSEIGNLSMNQVLMRSINTSATSLLPVGSLLFIGSYLLGAATLRQFALALFIGIAAGTYSSIFVASPLLAEWKEREPNWQRMQRRSSRGKGAPVAAARRVKAEPAPDVATERRDTGAAPRPPKQRRKRR
ncbi:MAG: protein translocase subunit SecF, partial [Acidimicrobiia bacterium]